MVDASHILELDLDERRNARFLDPDELDVYATGSNSKFLSFYVIKEFRGRGDEIRFATITSTWGQ